MLNPKTTLLSKGGWFFFQLVPYNTLVKTAVPTVGKRFLLWVAFPIKFCFTFEND